MCQQNEPEHSPAERDALARLAAEWSALAPRPARLDRDRLMFLAGQASASRQSASHHPWQWPAAFSAMTAVAAGLLAALVLRPAGPQSERIVYVPGAPVRADVDHREHVAMPQVALAPIDAATARRPTTSAPPVATYLSLRDRVLTQGIDSWQRESPDTSGGEASPPAGYQEMLKSLLQEPL